MKPLSPVLMAAHKCKSLLRESWYHWQRGSEGPCIADAINMAAPWEQPAVRSYLRLAFERYAPNGLVHYNDKPGRTHAQIMELCEAVILDEERRQARDGT